MQDGRVGAHRPMGNTDLVSYGIFQEEADIRAHVCVNASSVYVYKRESCVEVVSSGLYRQVPVYTGNIKTAMGFLVPPDEIKECVRIPVMYKVMEFVKFDKDLSTSQKGAKAVALVKWL